MEAAPELRPLGVGDIVDRVFAIYRSRLVPLLVIAAIPYLALVLAIGGITLVFGRSFLLLATAFAAAAASPRGGFTGFDNITAAQVGEILLWLALVIVAAIAATLVQSAALVDAMAARYMGRDTSVDGALGVGLRASPRLLMMGALAFLALCALWIVLVVLMAVTAQWWSILIGVFGGMFLTAYIAVSWMVSPPVLILESAGPVQALRRAWHLAAGHRWRILGLITLLTILESVLSSLLSFVVVASLVTDQTIQLIAQQAVNLLAQIAWAPIYWGTFAVLYYDLRVRKEALDLEVAAEALPRA